MRLVGPLVSGDVVTTSQPPVKNQPVLSTASAYQSLQLMTPPILDTIMRMPEVELSTGLRRSRIYELMKAGLFPANVKLSVRASGWRRSAIAQWINERTSQPLAA